MKHLRLIPLSLLLIFVFNYCSTEDKIPIEESPETGFLALNVALDIDELPAGRTAGVNTDNFIVTIHRVSDGIEVLRFDPFSSAPGEIELETGEYFVRATNLEPPENAEFEQPWYFGESEVFNIDKEELKTIDVVCTLANFKVSFVYSQSVKDNFTDWRATATLINEGNSLVWLKGDDREGYFITSPLNIDVYLEYTKVFTGELITRNFGTTINDPQPATHYRINIDASLEDGKIVINLSVDDSFEVIDIDLGDNSGKSVLLIWDEINANTNNLVASLEAEGYNVTLSATNETSYNGTNPSLSGFHAVIHLNGTTFATEMPIAGQNALVDFVLTDGNTYITDEWSANSVNNGQMLAMLQIVVLERSFGTTGSFTYDQVVAQAGHPILQGIPGSFTLLFGGSNIGPARTYGSNQPVVLMTSTNGAAVAVREFANGGRAIGFAYAGNYNGSTILSDPNVQKLYANSVSY